MAKNTSILLGDYIDNFISRQIKTGKYSSASEVVRAALRMFDTKNRKEPIYLVLKTEEQIYNFLPCLRFLSKGLDLGFLYQSDKKISTRA